jgi:hypothetical protein
LFAEDWGRSQKIVIITLIPDASVIRDKQSFLLNVDAMSSKVGRRAVPVNGAVFPPEKLIFSCFIFS